MGIPSTREFVRMQHGEAKKARALRSMRAEGVDNGARGSCQHPKPVSYSGPDRVLRKQYVACGRCLPCMFRKENEVVGKALCEAAVSDHVWLITLTYADLGLGLPEDEFSRSRLLRLDDVQAFLKRLRQKGVREGFSFRYMLAGEYGDKMGRAHWHLILFIQGNVPKLQFLQNVPALHFYWWPNERVERVARSFRGNATKRKRSKPGFGFEHVHIPQWPWGFVQIETEGIDQAALRYVAKYVAKGRLWAWSDAKHLTARDDAGVDVALAEVFRRKREEGGLHGEPHFSASTRPALGARFIRQRAFEIAASGAPVLQDMLMDAPNSMFTARGSREAFAPLRFHLGGAARREYLAGFVDFHGGSALDLPLLDRMPEGIRVSVDKLHYWREAREAKAMPKRDRAAVAAYCLWSPFASYAAFQKPEPKRGDLLDEWLRRSEGRNALTRWFVDPRASVDVDEFRFFDPALGEFRETS